MTTFSSLTEEVHIDNESWNGFSDGDADIAGDEEDLYRLSSMHFNLITNVSASHPNFASTQKAPSVPGIHDTPLEARHAKWQSTQDISKIPIMSMAYVTSGRLSGTISKEDLLVKQVQQIKNKKAGLFACTTCQETFKSNSTLYRHNRKMHKDKHSVKTYSCITCGKSFPDSWRLRRHELSKVSWQPHFTYRLYPLMIFTDPYRKY